MRALCALKCNGFRVHGHAGGRWTGIAHGGNSRRRHFLDHITQRCARSRHRENKSALSLSPANGVLPAQVRFEMLAPSLMIMLADPTHDLWYAISREFATLFTEHALPFLKYVRENLVPVLGVVPPSTVCLLLQKSRWFHGLARFITSTSRARGRGIVHPLSRLRIVRLTIVC